MRSAPGVPRPRRARPQRRRIIIVAVVAVLFLLLTSLRGIAGFYTDYLWFDEVGLTSVWRGVLGTKVMLAVVFTAVFLAAMLASLTIADRIAPRFRPMGPEDEFVQRYREAVGPHAGRVRVAVAGIFALIFGLGTSARWHEWLLFRNGVDFGVDDPLFHRDIAFFVFRLPFLKFVVDWLFVALVIITFVTVIAHYLNGGIRLATTGPVERVTPRVKAHVSVLLALLALAKAAGYYLQRFELTLSERGPVQGATYTDVKVQLPAIHLLIFVSFIAFALFLVNIWRQGWVLPGIGVGLWLLVSILAGGVVPAFVQQFRVEPAENRRERPYIERNIDATQAAYGLGGVEVVPFQYSEGLTASDLVDNTETVRNVRLWDPTHTKETFQKLQEIRSYYRFNDVDIDRYELDGRTTQVLLSVRDLKPDGLPERAQQSWVNRTLQYTHGFGAVVSPANAVSGDGDPQFAVGDVPPTGTPEITEPRVYFGENLGGYAIVNSEQPELDFQKDDGSTESTRYSGEAGVPLNSFLRRAALALRFGDMNPLISNLVTSESRAIYIRDIHERVRQAAPFLRYDNDPYPVIVDGEILWVQDAYTVTDRYPYSQDADIERVPNGSGLRDRFNYVRNSVKVTIDAYDGTMQFYVIDNADPLVRAYQKAFPELFATEDMPEELRRHLRYPEDLFRVQTNMYGRYHIDNPDEFYSAGDAWNVSQDPGSGEVTERAPAPDETTPGPTAPGPAGLQVAQREERMDPYYLLMRLPDEERESFLILQPFVPSASGGTERRNLTAFMIAKSDPDEYGQLQAYVMPRGQQIDGPALVHNKMTADSEVSSAISLLNQENSRVLLGNLLVVPIEQSLLHVRPLYVTPRDARQPRLEKVIVEYADRVVMRNTLQDALTEMFGEAPETLEEAPTEEEVAPGDEPDPTLPTGGDAVQGLLERAAAAFQAAEEALRAGDLAAYQQRVREAEALVRQAAEASRPPQTTTTAPGASA